VSELTSPNANFLLRSTDAEERAESDLERSAIGQAESPVAPDTRLFGFGRQHVLAFGLASSYVLFFTALFAAGLLASSSSLVVGLFCCWILGACFILRGARDVPQFNLTTSRVDVLIAIWGNLGVVAAATLVGDDMRLLLLVGVVFGVLYSGLHFSESRVLAVVLVTLIGYAACVMVRASFFRVSFELELMSALGLAVLLFASSLLAREVVRLRNLARARNTQLAKALRRVEELALRDELTGLYNRRHLLDFIDRAIATRERGGPAFALAYCDLDHFKQVNDRFGHECGDRLLKAFADAALKSVRTNDLVARLGGEEFVLVLVDADESSASDIVERLRMRTANIRVTKAEPDYKVTVSVGLATHSEDDTVEGILRRADGALYRAKDQGRDRLIKA